MSARVNPKLLDRVAMRMWVAVACDADVPRYMRTRLTIAQALEVLK